MQHNSMRKQGYYSIRGTRKGNSLWVNSSVDDIPLLTKGWPIMINIFQCIQITKQMEGVNIYHTVQKCCLKLDHQFFYCSRLWDSRNVEKSI